jgi:hypothetical protein
MRLASSAVAPARGLSQSQNAACHSADGRWVCVGIQPHVFAASAVPAIPPIAWSVIDWEIDPQNTTGCASDANDCISATCGSAGDGPCLTWAQVVSRLGSKSPSYDGAVSSLFTVTFLSSQSAGVDMIDFQPILQNGAQHVIQTRPVQVASGTLSSVTLNTVGVNGSGMPLKAALPGASAQFDLVINTTRANSRSLVLRIDTGIATLTQPTAAGGLIPASVTTWVSGDAVTVYSMPSLNVARYRAATSAQSIGGRTAVGGIYQATLVAPGQPLIDYGNLPLIRDCIVEGYTTSRAGAFVDDIFTVENPLVEPLICGGACTGTAVVSATGYTDNGDSGISAGFIDDCALFSTSNSVIDAGVYITTAGLMFILGRTDIITGGFFYGPGKVQVIGAAQLNIPNTSTSGVDVFKNGTLQIGQLSASSAYDTSTGVWHPSIALGLAGGVGANLDQTIGGGGFAGSAVSPGFGSIVKTAY